MRLIDGDALAKFIDYGHLNNPNDKCYSENDIREMIDMMPTVDAVPVIRCKDCKYYRDGDCWHERENDRWIYYRSVINEPNPDDYCSLAERKKNEQV